MIRKTIKKCVGMLAFAVIMTTSLGMSFEARAEEGIAVVVDTPSKPASQDYFGNQTGSYSGYNYCKNWAYLAKSFMVDTGSGYMTVRAFDANKKVEIVDYSYDFQADSSKTFKIDYELDAFGGFYCGEDYNILVFGQDNPEENDNSEVIRVVKYDKNWKRLGQASIKGANTTVIFDHGGIAMVEDSGLLHVRTCHTMYKSSDGRNHQASMSFAVNISDMSVINGRYEVDGRYGEYVSHSFDQRLILDDGYLVYLDLGDAYPRSAVLGKYAYKSDGTTPAGMSYRLDTVSYPGAVGDNYIGGSIGGLEASAENYLTAGNTAPLSEDKFKKIFVRNVYVSSTSKEEKNTELNMLTDYPESGNTYASTPYLIKLNDNKFFVAWDIMTWSGYKTSTTGKFSYLFVDGNGKELTKVCSSAGSLSDCEPIADGKGNVVWYTLNESQLNFYRVNSEGQLSVSGNNIPVGPVTEERKITYVVGEDVVMPGDAASTYQEGVKMKLAAVPTRLGYKFAGWYLDKECTLKAKITGKTRGDLVLYPRWKGCRYTVQYRTVSSNVVEKPMAKQKFTLGKNKVFKQPNEKKLAKAGLVQTPGAWTVLFTTSLNGSEQNTEPKEAEVEKLVEQWKQQQLHLQNDVEIVEVYFDKQNMGITISYFNRNVKFQAGMLQTELENRCFDCIGWMPKGKGYIGTVNLYPLY